MYFTRIVSFIRELYSSIGQIPLHEPYFTGNELKYVKDCIDSTYVSSVGRYVDRFEDMIRDYTGTKHAIATVNGTAALHTALQLSGVRSGDLVITQPLTFIATCNAISYCGAEPVFIDIDRITLGLSADAVKMWLEKNAEIIEDKSRIPYCIHKDSGKKISACVPMHTFGHPCEIGEIIDICDPYHIPVVEDAAESIGSYYMGKHTGTFGRFGILSFNGNKTITTGGGGMILTNDDLLGKLAKHITTTAKKPHPWIFDHDMVAYNYRMPNINAALGCAQMENLEKILAGKREIASAYEAFFKNIREVEFVKEPNLCRSNYWLNSIFFEDEVIRNEFLDYSNSKNIQTRPVWNLMNSIQMYKRSIQGKCEVSEMTAGRLVNIPSGVRCPKKK
jgi:aminotransferase in exopolysaccharide biosynthesis